MPVQSSMVVNWDSRFCVPAIRSRKLHVHLQPMTRLRLLVALPALAVWLMLLVGRQPPHPVPRENAVH